MSTHEHSSRSLNGQGSARTPQASPDHSYESLNRQGSTRTPRNPDLGLPLFAVRARLALTAPGANAGPWPLLAWTADHQRGILLAADLAAAGLDRGAIEHALRTRRLIRLHRGIYALGHCQLRDEGWLLAAIRATGHAATLCARTAAWWWEIENDAPTRVDVTCERRRHDTAALRHHALRLHPDDVTVHRGLPVTTVARTLLDVAREPDSEDAVRRLLAEAAFRRRIDPASIPHVIARTRGHRGARRLRAVAERHQPELALARSELERRFVELLAAAGIPMPRLNDKVGRYTVDAHWQRQKVIVELDGWQAHGHRLAFHADRARDRTLTLAGYRVLRFTWREAIHQRALVARTLHRALA